MAFAPAIVVGDHGHGGVADFSFAGQLGLLQIGHADDVGAPAAIKVGLGLGGELRTFHAHVGSAELANNADRRTGVVGGFRDSGAHRIAKGYVAHNAFAEERGDAMKGAVDELVGHDKVGWLVLFLERADGGDGQNALDAEFFECVDVGAEVQLRGQNAMAATVTSEEGHFAAFEVAEDKRVRRLAERRLNTYFAHICESGHGVKSAAANNANFCLSQGSFLFLKQAFSLQLSARSSCFMQPTSYRTRGWSAATLFTADRSAGWFP